MIRTAVACMASAALSFTAFAGMDLSELKKNSSKLLSAASIEDQARTSSSEEQVDNSLDSTQYFIGGGDEFMISVIELPSIQYTGTVNENCDVYISELGIITIGKKNLAQSKKIIADFVRSKLKKQLQVYVSLVKIKFATVTVTGAVANPGTYKLFGSFRLLDAIKMANNNALPSYADVNYREVECRNRDSLAVHDVFRFLAKGDCLQNPYVYPGDNLVLNYASTRVFLCGAVKYPPGGYVPIKRNEPLGEFLSLVSFDAPADSSHIILQRTAGGSEPQQQVFSMKTPQDYSLADRDLVIVSEKENYPSVFAVMVKGEVVRPGFYPFVKNHTTAEEIIRQAGGPTPLAHMDKAYVIRHKKMYVEELKQNYGPLKPYLTGGYIDNSVRPEVNSAFFHMNASNDFCIQRLTQNKDGTLLEDDDEIVIPRREYYVYVSGSVRHPGAYLYKKGERWDYYVENAGGFSSKADKANTFVFAQFGPVMQLKEKGIVDEGDVVVVPDSQQYRFLSAVFIPILSALAITVSTVLAIVNITR
jgi:protein involved in polysaccharide export with SLBB domain